MTTIVIVDDHPSFRASARTALEAGGFDVVGEAEDGTSALDLVHRVRPDIVILDVQLPDMSGFEVCTGCDDLENIAIVLVSSRDGVDYGDLIARSGARGFIPKAELSGETVAALVA